MKRPYAALTALTALAVAGCAAPDHAGDPPLPTQQELPVIALYGPASPEALPLDLAALGPVASRTSGAAYRLEIPGDLSDLGSELAAALGLPRSPAPEAYMDTEWGEGQLVFGDQDGAHLYVAPDGSWYYSARLDTAIYECEAAGDGTEEECALASLDPDEVVTLATDVARRLGLAGQLTPLEPGMFDGGYAEAQLLVGDEPSGLWFGFGFAPSGQLAYAYGQLATPELVGEYPLLSAQDTAQRLAGSLGDWYPYGAQVVRPVSATFALFPFFDIDGSWWLLPGYMFVLDNGEELIEQAVSEPYLRLVPRSYDETEQPGMSPSMAAEVLAERIVGLTEQDAQAALEREPFPWRILRRDDEWMAGTMDFIPDRLNLEVDGGVVTRVTFG